MRPREQTHILQGSENFVAGFVGNLVDKVRAKDPLHRALRDKYSEHRVPRRYTVKMQIASDPNRVHNSADIHVLNSKLLSLPPTLDVSSD